MASRWPAMSAALSGPCASTDTANPAMSMSANGAIRCLNIFFSLYLCKNLFRPVEIRTQQLLQIADVVGQRSPSGTGDLVRTGRLAFHKSLFHGNVARLLQFQQVSGDVSVSASSAVTKESKVRL